MTRAERLECIDRIQAVDTDNHATTVYDDFYDILSEYDDCLADDLLDDYCHEDTVVSDISQLGELQDIQLAVENLDASHGIYYYLGGCEYEDADMDQLKRDIIQHLQEMGDEDEEEEDDYDEEEDSDEEWIEEDDDFLTKKGN